ncbi:unnamed protein product [Pleuronectes platessa]|uniref:Uncharacterized protein n=1 Tax=Pleuronectes platessa TaxID=8262 RepID=A0A9N7TNG3_PLEPL|nr:unnamed protein product [Pleuronectes platessa]
MPSLRFVFRKLADPLRRDAHDRVSLLEPSTSATSPGQTRTLQPPPPLLPPLLLPPLTAGEQHPTAPAEERPRPGNRSGRHRRWGREEEEEGRKDGGGN